MNTSLFLYLHGFAGQSSVGDWLIVFFGEYLLYIVLAVCVFVCVWYWHQRMKRSLYLMGVALAGALIARFALTPLIRHFYHHPRPFVTLGVPHLLSDTSYSFPSGHTIFLFALATGVYFFNKRLAYFVYTSAVVIAVARIMGGVHYPFDILGGAVLGALVGAAAYYSAKKFLFIA